MTKTALILPLKESFSNKDFGAVSIWVNYYLNNSKKSKDYIFCKKIKKNQKYLNKKTVPIEVESKFYTNQSYIKKISDEIKKKNISIVEIHNRPEYAFYLFKNNPEIKINLIFHNDPNTIRNSDSKKNKLHFIK